MTQGWMAEMAELLNDGYTRMPPFAQAWQRPHGVRVEGEDLLWDVDESRRRRGVLVPDSGLLEQFIALADASPEDIASFARDFGTLNLCRHGAPWRWEHDTGGKPENWRFCKPAGREPLQAWRNLAQFCRTVLASAEAIEAGRRLSQERYNELAFFADLRHTFVDNEDGRPMDRYVLALGVNAFLGRAVQVGISFETPRDVRPRMQFSGKSVLDAIALQLGMAVCRAESSATCDGCGKTYVRDRPARAGRRNFCPECRAKGVPQKLASRDRRMREREGRTKQEGIE